MQLKLFIAYLTQLSLAYVAILELCSKSPYNPLILPEQK